jgi:hypothetical protein
MASCTICGEELKPEQKVCDTCGTSVPTTSAATPTATAIPSAPPAPPPLPRSVPPPLAAAPSPQTQPAHQGQSRVCPICQTHYAADYQDEFCRCGGELIEATSDTQVPVAVSSPVAIPASAPAPQLTTPLPLPVASGKPVRPAAGTVCLVVYSEQKEPIHYCPIAKDVTIIGRSDPVRGDFPDLDLAELFDTTVSRRISRKHAMVLRSRTTGAYSLRPLGGNTGTQIEKELATQLQDYPLTSGTRLVLGGVIRLKFEVM